MSRPKSTAPKKQKLTLTVSAQSRVNLEFISNNIGKSISEFVEEYAAKEAKRIAKQTKQEIPDAEQMKLEDLDQA